MKLAATLIAASAGLAMAKKPAKKAVDLTATHKVSGENVRKLVRNARKLDDNNNNNNNQDDEFYFLTQYAMKFVQCVPDYKVSGDDAYEYSAVIVRLCDVESEESKSAFGCTDDEKYGDYVLGINTYTQLVAQQMEEDAQNNGNNNNNNGNEFNLEEYAECREADFDNQDDEGRRLDQQGWYFIGPKCIDVTNDKGKVIGSDIGLEFFSDEYCSQESSVSYYELTGMEIPYHDGLGLSGSATTCSGYNENGEMEIKEMCQRLVEDVAIRCDGMSTYGCDEIESLEAALKEAEKPKNGWKIFLIVVVALLGVGAAFWFLKKKKKGEALLGGSNAGTMS